MSMLQKDSSDYHSVEDQLTRKNRTTTCLLTVALIGAAAVAIGMGAWVYKLKHDDSSSSGSGNQYTAIAQMIDSVRDTSIDPCQDFYAYACNGWMKSHTIPADESRFSRSFTLIADSNTAVLQDVMNEDWPVIGPFYQSCMDTATIDKLGVAPIQPWMTRIEQAATTQALWAVAGEIMAEIGVDSFFSVQVIVDSKNPTVNVLDFGQGGLQLPATSYYIGPNNVLPGYLNHTTRMFTLWGAADAAQAAQDAVNFETAIAGFTLDPDQLRDPEKIYHKVNFVELEVMAPQIHWDAFLNGSMIPHHPLDANVEWPPYLNSLNTLVKQSTTQQLRNYLRWQLLHQWASYLPTPFANENFYFFSTVLSGQTEQTPRPKSCTSQTDAGLGDITGRYFVERAFPGSSYNTTVQLIGDIKLAFGNNLPNVDWMDNTTRAAAATKLSLVTDLVGYPSKWADYSTVSITSTTFIANLISIQQFSWVGKLKTLAGPVDKTKWQMTAATVNAYYDPSYNTINFPAGIIQPTFFSAAYPAAMNYGGIGMVMGHELSHGFDDQGRQYDGHGKLTQWWSPEVVARFTQRAACLVNQYNQFKYTNPPIPDMHVNGNLTLGENIADNGGIRTAFRAYKAHVAKYGDDPQLPTNPPMSNDQLFFLAFAQGWCTLIREDLARQMLQTDVHSPAFARVLGPLQNYDAFSTAFNCAPGTPMNPAGKCNLW